MTEICQSCGAKKPEPKRYTLGASMVSGLERLLQVGGGPITRKDLGLTGVEYSVFQKTSYWRLVEKVDGERWRLTDLGRSFLSGEARVPRTAWAANGVVVSLGDDFTTAKAVTA